ncbi:PREDICTED: DNA-directed RNA polymerase III subunit RPC3 [Nelumbo nucifera]|uniref:DNA-directed RNA polymerase III subunit RPC3 n=1 Tax=Nelumbo nucifera TaxID=4432 RepID=A0A1U7ZCI1_NELNU|nr:PREDICTED: DNA-directed RNA polymerase III subunit RPC3 [Nelumbo nucifera]
MATQYSIKLAISLISSHFGDLVAKVCECLLRKGSLTLADITRFTELPQAQVKNCLLVLIQHNCVQAFSIQIEGGVGAAPKVITQYTAIFDNILHRMRFPKFLTIVSEELDKECEEILEGLFQHGRLTLEQIILRAVSNQNEGNSTVQDAVRESFVRIVSSHYVERCPASEPFLAPPDEEENPTKKRAKSARLAEEIETLEKRAISAAAPLESERFAVITDTGTDVKSGDRSGSRFLDTAIGEKRKHEALEMDRETMATICEKEVLWRANFEAFIRRLRHKACVANVRARMDDGACTVLNAMLEATRNAESRIKTENSVPLSMDAILAEVMKSEGGRSMTVERVRAALGQLGCRSSPRGAEDSHSVDLRNIIEIAQNDEMESIVLKRYGRDAYRIFRLLSKTGRLVETDKISDITFVDKKEAPKILYNLWKDNYLHMEKLTSQGSKQSDFLLWKVNRSSLWKQILDEMCHAALNLSQRLAYEFEQEHEILQLPREKRVGAQGKRFERIRKVKVILESSLMKLDDAIMLFHDF